MAAEDDTSERLAPAWTPSWSEVEQLLDRLSAAGTRFPTASSVDNRISRYEPGRRLMLENDIDARWVRIPDIRACWDTFERLGRIYRRDVLDPGRCSAFMMALFAQVDGVVTDGAESGECLALRGRSGSWAPIR